MSRRVVSDVVALLRGASWDFLLRMAIGGALVLQFGLLPVPSFANSIPAFTRQVDRMTGKKTVLDNQGHLVSPGRVTGQDTSGLVAYDVDLDGVPDEMRIFFGDTFYSSMHPYGLQTNNMTRTQDWNASDGIDLDYWTISGEQMSFSVEVLHPISQAGEHANWLQSGFQVGADIYSFFYKVQPDWPNFATNLGSGLAYMPNGMPPYPKGQRRHQPECRLRDTTRT